MNDKLTSKAYWEKYYAGAKRQKKHILEVCSYYETFWKQLVGDQYEGKEIIEIGGFPGRFLAYLASQYNVRPTCLDYNSNVDVVRENFKVMEVAEYTVLQQDFTTFKPVQTYDFIISLGFVEHFKDFDKILDLHLVYAKPGSRLMVVIPNKRYFRKWYGLVCDYNNLRVHNLKCMNLKVFKAFAKRKNLKILNLQYYGGFPYTVHQKLNGAQKLIYKVTRHIFKYWINPQLMKNPSKYFSESIVAIFEVPD